MKVLIVARTRMGGQTCCVGGLELPTNRSLRLLQSNGFNMPESLPLEIGEVWEMEYIPRSDLRPPHVEDMVVKHYDYVRRQDNLSAFLCQRVRVWRGSPSCLFSGKLCATPSGSGYVCAQAGIPDRSTGYWISDQDMVLQDQNDRVRYHYPGQSSIRNLPFVGLAKPAECLPKGTLLRVSLARWWKPESAPDGQERCYLQLSGWY